MGKVKNYSIEGFAREKAVVVVVFVAIVLSALLYSPTNMLVEALVAAVPNISWLQLIGLLGAIEPMAIYGILWALYSKRLWRLSVFRRLHHIPDLSGQWKGSYQSSYPDQDGQRTTKDMTMTIHQTFTSINIRCVFPGSSESYAEVVGILDCDEENDSCTLEFSYNNNATDGSQAFDPNRDNSHIGLNILRITGREATGSYVTLRNASTKGYMTLIRS